MSQPASDKPSSPRPRSLAGYIGIFVVSTGLLCFLFWWNQHGAAMVSSLLSLAVTRLHQIGVNSPDTLTAGVSILGGLAVTIAVYWAKRPRSAATAIPRPRPRIDPNSPIEMPLPPEASPPLTVILAVFLSATVVAMALMPFIESVMLLGAFEFRTREELIGDGFTPYGLISGAVRFVLSVSVGAAALAWVEIAYRRAACNWPDEAP